jgi:uridine kinase
MAGVPLNLPQTITVTVGDVEYKTSRGTRVKPFLRRFLPGIEPECLGAVVANRLVDLETPIASNCTLVPVTYASKEGARIYRATLAVLLSEAVARLFPGARVQVGQSFGDAVFFEVIKEPSLLLPDVEALELEMRAMVDRKAPIAVMRVPRQEAIEALRAAGAEASADVVLTSRRSWVPLVTMGERLHLWFQPLLPTAEGIRGFAIRPWGGGLVVCPPPAGHLDEPPAPLRGAESLYAVYRETRMWNQRVGVASVPDLNRTVIGGTIGEVIRVAEALHERKIVAIADGVVERRSCRLVTVAGPSSSGKTTFVKRLRMQLLAAGLRPKELSLDNYYVDREKTPRDEAGEFDFESLEAIDLDLLNTHLIALMKGEEVQLPRYSFPKGMRDAKTTPMRLGPDEVLLIEGIHGLNDRLTESVPSDQKFKLYVSALTQLVIDDHNRVFTSDARLIRRIVRDRLFRGYDAARSIHMWPKVRAGEERWIFPHQPTADATFNSTLVYEPAVLKVFAERFLMEVPEDDPAHVEAVRLLEFLDLFVPVFAEDVPATSILREFVGGSAFRY